MFLDSHKCLYLENEVAQVRCQEEVDEDLVNATTDFLTEKYKDGKEYPERSDREEVLHNREIGRLMLLETKDEESGKDLYELVYNYGVPHEKRSQVWREFFKTQILEVIEIQEFKTKFPAKYDPKITLY
jgi:hypothetical protein